MRYRKVWSRYLPLVARIMNYPFHSAIGTYPARVLFGDNCRGLSLPGKVLFDPSSLFGGDKQGYVAGLCKAQQAITSAASQYQDKVINLRAAKFKAAGELVTLDLSIKAPFQAVT